MRRHFSNYFKGLPHFKEIRLRLLTTLDVDEIRGIVGEIRQLWGDFRTDVKTSVYGI